MCFMYVWCQSVHVCLLVHVHVYLLCLNAVSSDTKFNPFLYLNACMIIYSQSTCVWFYGVCC